MHKNNREYYDEFANWYERGRHGGYHAMIDDLEVDLLDGYLDGKDVLEVGCGTGLILERVARHARQAVGIDLSRGMLDRAAGRGLQVVQGDVTALPFTDNAFDLVYSFKVLAHIKPIDQALREMARVTRPGGRLILEFYNPYSLRYLAKRAAGPGKISVDTDEDAIYTRWDAPAAVTRRMPDNVRVVDFSGIRIVTPAAAVHKVPWIGAMVRKLEFASRDSPLKYFGGFLVVVAQKESG